MSASNERPEGVSRAAWQVEKFLAALATFSFERAPLAAGITIAVTVVFAYLAHTLGLNTDVTQLLPSTFESVRDVKRVSEEFGGVGYVSVVAQGDDRESLVRFAEDVAPKLSALPTVRYVDYKRPIHFFEDRGLYFLDQADLESMRDRIEKRRDWEVTRATGAQLDEDAPPPPLDFSDLETKYKDRLSLGDSKQEKREAEYYVSPDGKMLALLVKPTRLASDFKFCKTVTADVESVMEGIDKSKYGLGFKVDLSGRYKKRVDVQNVVAHDLKIASVVAFVLILLYVSFHFRRVSAVVLVFLPLVSALTATYGFAAITIGSLNILTSFIGAIILGLGVDNGIHLLNRYYEERGSGKEPIVAIQKAFGEAARASSAAMLTNVGAFLCLLIADFKAFREFGVLAAGGMFFTLISYVVVVPVLLGLGQRLFASKPSDDAPPFGYARPLVRWAPAVFYGMGLLLIFAITRIPDVRFNYDFSVMDEADLPSFHLDKKVNQLIGRSQTPLVVFAATEEEAEATGKQMRDTKAKLGAESTIERVMVLSDLVPKEQAAKAPVIEDIGALVGKLRAENLVDDPEAGSAPRSGIDHDKKKRQRDDLVRMAAAKPFAKTDLPQEVKRQFQKPGSEEFANFVLVYPGVSMSDGRQAQRVAKEVRGIQLADGKDLHASGEPLVMADILSSMQGQLPIIFGLALLQQIILLWILMGSLERGLLTIFPAVVTMPLLIGLLPYFHLRFDYLNIILLPTLLGMGEDGGAHLVARVSSGDKLKDALGYTARGTLGAGITAALGFGAMVVASHPGLRSFGLVAVIGLALNLVVCLVFLPSLIALLDMRRTWRDEGRGGLVSLLATMFFAGATPRGGGTVGALLAIPVAWTMRSTPVAIRVGAAVLLSAAAVVVSNRYLLVRSGVLAAAAAGQGRAVTLETVKGKEGDPQEIVLDEFVGALLAMAMVGPRPVPMLLAFVLFRVFDIVKPWPVSFFDRKVKGGLGVVADDVVAGALAGMAVLVLQRLIPTL